MAQVPPLVRLAQLRYGYSHYCNGLLLELRYPKFPCARQIRQHGSGAAARRRIHGAWPATQTTCVLEEQRECRDRANPYQGLDASHL